MAKQPQRGKRKLVEFLRGFGDERLQGKIEARLVEMKKVGDPNFVTFDDPQFFEIYAGAVLRLNYNSPFDKPLDKAFKVARLDHKNPIHWRLLLSGFAVFHFGMERPRGTPKKRSGLQYSELFDRIQNILSDKPNLKVRSEVSRLLKKRYPGEYGSLSIRHLNRLGRQAADPNKNPKLKLAVDQLALGTRVFDYERHGLVWTPEIEADKRREFLAWVLRVTKMDKLDKKVRKNSCPTK